MTNILKGQRPDITPAQVIALVFGAIYPVLVLLGIDLDQDRLDALEQLRILAIGLFGADAAIRIGRNYAAGKTAEAGEGDVPPEDDPDLVPEPDVPAEAPSEAELSTRPDLVEDAPSDAMPEGAVGGKRGETGF